MATKYYNSAGKELKGNDLKKYLKALEKAEKTGKPYTGKKYYTREELESMYNGYDLGVIQQLGKLRSLLKEAPAQYKALSDDELMAQATAQAEQDYQKTLTQAQNAYNTSNTSLLNQLQALDPTYQAQVNAANKQTAQNVDSLTGSMLSRGLGRSSYAGALQQATQQAGTNAVNAIMADKAQKQNEINNQISTLGQNFGSITEMLGNTRDAAIKSGFGTLKQQDFEKGMSIADARTNYLLNLLTQKKKVSSGGGGSPGGNRSYTPAATNPTTGSSIWDQAMEWINNLFK
jgi:hypothetical protein